MMTGRVKGRTCRDPAWSGWAWVQALDSLVEEGERVTGDRSATPRRLHAGADAMLRSVDALVRSLRARGATGLVLFGSLAQGPSAVGPLSDVDLAVVIPGIEEVRPHRHPTELPEVDEFPYPLDLCVYSPAEWARARETSFVREEVLAKGRAVP